MSILLIWASIGFAGSGFLTLITLTESISAQIVWTFVALILLLATLLGNIDRFTKRSRVALIVSLGMLFLLAASALHEGAAVRSLNFLAGAAGLILAFAIGIKFRKATNYPSPLVIAILMQPLVAGALIVTLNGKNFRLASMTIAFAILFLLVLGNLRSTPRYFVSMSTVPILAGFFFIGLAGARMAALIASISLLVFAVSRIKVSSLTQLFMLPGSLSVLALGFAYSARPTPLVGGDNGISIGATAINTSGRRNWVEGAIVSMTESTLTELVFGQGIGSAREVALSVSPFDVLNNEYARLLVDTGIFGLSLWVGFLTVTTAVGVLCFRKTGQFFRGLSIILLAAGAALASSTEEFLGYTWIVLPFGLLMGSLWPDIPPHKWPRPESSFSAGN